MLYTLYSILYILRCRKRCRSHVAHRPDRIESHAAVFVASFFEKIPAFKTTAFSYDVPFGQSVPALLSRLRQTEKTDRQVRLLIPNCPSFILLNLRHKLGRFVRDDSKRLGGYINWSRHTNALDINVSFTAL